MKIVLTYILSILIIALTVYSALADTETITTAFNITLYNDTSVISILTENGMFNYSFLNLTSRNTENKTLSLTREFEDEPVSESNLSKEVESALIKNNPTITTAVNTATESAISREVDSSYKEQQDWFTVTFMPQTELLNSLKEENGNLKNDVSNLQFTNDQLRAVLSQQNETFSKYTVTLERENKIYALSMGGMFIVLCLFLSILIYERFKGMPRWFDK